MSNNTNVKKDVSVLGLAPTQPTNSLGLVPYASHAPHAPQRREVTREEARVIETFHREELIVDLVGEKGKLGMRKIGEVQEVASDLFEDIVSFILQNKDEARGTEAQPYVDEFAMRQIQMYARHMLGTLEVVRTNIGIEVHRSLNLPPEQRGLWARLLDK